VEKGNTPTFAPYAFHDLKPKICEGRISKTIVSEGTESISQRSGHMNYLDTSSPPIQNNIYAL
jgi:hypothetical protein